MNSSKLSSYVNEMPDEARLLLKGLSDESSLGIIIALLKNGKMSFNEMKEEFELSSSSLTNRLNELQDGNLITNFYEKTTQKNFSYYDVTDIPEKIFDSVYEIIYSLKHNSENLGNIDRYSLSMSTLNQNIDQENISTSTIKKQSRFTKMDQREGVLNYSSTLNNPGTT